MAHFLNFTELCGPSQAQVIFPLMLKDDAVNHGAGGLIALAFGLFVILLH